MGDQRPLSPATRTIVVARTTNFWDSPQQQQQQQHYYSDPNNDDHDPLFSSIPHWRSSQSRVPMWMKRYFLWHQQARAHIHQTGHWHEYQYLVVRCLRTDAGCGGTGDRLRGLPTAVLLANRTRRLLFYYWHPERPCAMTEFLVPNRDGINWTWPPHPTMPFEQVLQEQAPLYRRHEDALLEHVKTVTIFQKKKQNNHSRKNQTYYYVNVTVPISEQRVLSIVDTAISFHTYDRWREDPRHDYQLVDAFAHIWHAVVRPSPPVQQRIQQRMQEWQLWLSSPLTAAAAGDQRNRHYHAIHIRSQYFTQFSPELLRDIASNALHCLQQIVVTAEQREQQLQQREQTANATVVWGLMNRHQAPTPIFVASDGSSTVPMVTQLAVERNMPVRIVPTITNANMTNTTTPITTTNTATKPVHLDRGLEFLVDPFNVTKQNITLLPEQYYDTFVDLYIMARAKCLVTGLGFFGRLANWLSDDSSCHLNTAQGMTEPLARKCPWIPSLQVTSSSSTTNTRTRTQKATTTSTTTKTINNKSLPLTTRSNTRRATKQQQQQLPPQRRPRNKGGIQTTRWHTTTTTAIPKRPWK
ncbi:hypothetical protein ACA910_002768 [Epithemia clementina (nom. ined.)]